MRHATRTPDRRIVRLALQRASDYRFDALIIDRAWRTGTWFHRAFLDPLVKEAAAPLADRHGMHTKLMADHLVLQPIGTGQDNTRALGKHLSRLWPRHQRRQFRALSRRQRQRFPAVVPP